MARLTPQPWHVLQKVFELDGFVVERVAGSHVVLTKPGVLRPVVLPSYDEVGLDIIRANMRTAGMSRTRYLGLLARVR